MSTLGRSAHTQTATRGSDKAAAQTDAVRATIGTGVIGGFGTAAAMWLAWFITHLPAIRLPIAPSGVLLLAILVLGTATTARFAPAKAGGNTGNGRTPIFAGALAGLIAATINLMLLGSKIVEQPQIDPTQLDPAAKQAAGVGQLVPNAALVIAGFLLLSAVAGAIAALIARRRAASLGPLATPRHRLAAMATITCCATAPLLFIGGLVTSTESGMAVPDWPGSYGANMFLYPIGLMAHPRIFLEHAHRLFGSLVGLTVLVFAITTYLWKAQTRTKVCATIALALVLPPVILAGIRLTTAAPPTDALPHAPMPHNLPLPHPDFCTPHSPNPPPNPHSPPLHPPSHINPHNQLHL